MDSTSQKKEMKRFKEYLKEFCDLELKELLPKGIKLFPIDVPDDSNNMLKAIKLYRQLNKQNLLYKN
ncbi:MAG: hypothetical protein HQK77_18505 [Desulfobacterales bacterium]|nr:hypothetical protein [Desulfobacterales bacterium]